MLSTSLNKEYACSFANKIIRSGSWWFVVVRGGFSLKFSTNVTHKCDSKTHLRKKEPVANMKPLLLLLLAGACLAYANNRTKLGKI